MNIVNCKVIKEFGNAKIGDTFAYDSEEDAYHMYVVDKTEDYMDAREMWLVPEIVEVLINEARLAVIEDATTSEPKPKCDNCERIEKVKDFVYKQIEDFKKANTEIADKYEKGEIQPCVKVESDTAHYNLLKILNHIKDLINE